MTDNLTRISGTKFLAHLPGPGPWKLCVWRGYIIAVSANAEPVAISPDGKQVTLRMNELAAAADEFKRMHGGADASDEVEEQGR
jgi:hypothetical protein